MPRSPASLEEARSELSACTDRLDAAQVILLVRMAKAMGETIESRINPDSDLLTHNVAVAFSNQLLLHHATHEEKLNKKAFEYLFKYSCEADGRSAVINHNPTLAGEDIRVDGKKFSLKTQADGAIKDSALYIQKLMEARWIRECVSREDFAREATRRISSHLSHYERILVLRAFDKSAERVRYQLLEIPRELLERIATLSPDDFSERNKFGSSGADVRDDRGRAFRVLLDGSVEKVRIFNLKTDRCIFHGEWTIPRPRPIQTADE